MKVILASASERRQELLKRLVDDFSIVVSDFDEGNVKLGKSISDYVENIALGKAKDVMKKTQEPSIIVGADTVVAFNDEVLGKPRNKADACNMLKRLSDNVHNVYTGIVLVNSSTGEVLKDYVKTEVVFSKLSEKQIYDYVESNEPMDKAGAYGIQGKGGIFVKEIRGCYYNVVGLPLNKLNEMLKDIKKGMGE